jgi:hypothetical protein
MTKAIRRTVKNQPDGFLNPRNSKNLSTILSLAVHPVDLYCAPSCQRGMGKEVNPNMNKIITGLSLLALPVFMWSSSGYQKVDYNNNRDDNRFVYSKNQDRDDHKTDQDDHRYTQDNHNNNRDDHQGYRV